MKHFIQGTHSSRKEAIRRATGFRLNRPVSPPRWQHFKQYVRWVTGVIRNTLGSFRRAIPGTESPMSEGHSQQSC